MASASKAGGSSKPPHSAALPPLRGLFGLANRPNGLSISLAKVTKGLVLARNAGVGLTIWNFLASNRKGRLSVPALAGVEFFPFGRFEHRMDDTGEGCTWLEGAADAGGDSGSSKSPALKPRTAKVEQASRETFRPEWAYVG